MVADAKDSIDELPQEGSVVPERATHPSAHEGENFPIIVWFFE